jgi:hypothetical protein
MTGGVGKYGGGQIPEKPADKEKQRPQSKTTEAAKKSIEASFEETEKETREVKRAHSDVTLKANKLEKAPQIQDIAAAKLIAPDEKNKGKPEHAADSHAKAVAEEDTQDEKKDSIRGIPRWDKEPASWDFELFDTYQRLISCNREFFEALDAESLEACKKIAIYYQDRSEGIDIADEELNAIRKKLAAVSKEIVEARDDEGIHLISNAQHIYDMFHPITPVLASDMEREIFRFLGEKKLVHSAHTTSKEMQEKIYQDISLRRRILFAEAKNVVDQIAEAKNAGDYIEGTCYKGKAQSEIAKAQAVGGDIRGAKATAAEINHVGYKDEAKIAIAKAQVVGGDLQGAKATAAEINSVGYKAQVQIEIAIAQAKSGDLQGAKDSIAFAIATVAEINHVHSKAQAQIAIAKAQTMSGDLQGAKATAAEINQVDYKASAQIEIAIAQAMSGDLQGAKDSIAFAIATAAEIQDDYYKAQVQIKIAKVQAKSGDIQGAKATAAEIQNASSKAQVQIKIAKVQVKSGDIQGAKATAAEIQDDYYKTIAQLEIAIAQAMSGDLQGAKDSIAFAIATVAEINHVHPKAIVQVEIAKVQAMIGDLQGAIILARLIEDPYQRALAFVQLAL